MDFVKFKINDNVTFENCGIGKGEIVQVLERNSYRVKILESDDPKDIGLTTTMHSGINTLRLI